MPTVELVNTLEQEKLKGLLTLLGDDAVALKKDAKQIAEVSGVKKIPVVIAKETKTGPLNYRLPSDADVTAGSLPMDSSVNTP